MADNKQYITRFQDNGSIMISEDVTIFSISVFAVYFMLCMMPCYIEIKERIKWNVIKSKI